VLKFSASVTEGEELPKIVQCYRPPTDNVYCVEDGACER